jgi:methyl-accepting chemotaxis protein
MIKWDEEKNNLFIENEVESNKISAKALLITVILSIPVSVLVHFRILGEKIDLLPVLIISMLILSIPISLILIFRVRKWWIKYLLISTITFLLGILSVHSANSLTIAWILALVLSSLYFSKELTWYSFILLMVVQVFSGIVSVKMYPQFYGNLWYIPVFSFVMQLLITFPVFLSLSILTEGRFKKFARNEKEQNSLVEKMISILNKTSEASKYVAVEIKRYISIADKSKNVNETMSRLSNQVVKKSEDNTQHINNAYSTIQIISQKLNTTSSDLEKIANMSTKAFEIKQHVKGFIDSATDQMMSISKNKQESKKLIYKVGERSLEVKRIVEIISSIARDTKLVAFNAQVESAKAGIHGKGFAVLAVEVVKLAELNKQASTEITELVNNIQSLSKKAMGNIDSGSQMIDRGLGSFNTLNAIFNSFSEVSDEKQRQIQSLSNESKEIAKAALEIAQRVKKIKEINQKCAEEFKDISVLTQEQYNSMQQIISVAEKWEGLSDKLVAITRE